MQAYQGRLQELAAIVKRAPAVAQPVGFAAQLWGHMDGYGPPAPGQPPGKRVPLAGSLSFGAFPLIEFTRNGRLMNEDMKGGETQLLHFTVNRIEMGMYSSSKPMEWGQQDIDGFVEPKTGDPVSGLPRVDDVVVVKKNAKPLWVPLSVEDALKPVIEERRLAFASRRDVYAKQVAEYKEWQTPAKRAGRRAGWERAAASLPSGGDFLVNAEKSDAAIEAMNRERLAPGGTEACRRSRCCVPGTGQAQLGLFRSGAAALGASGADGDRLRAVPHEGVVGRDVSRWLRHQPRPDVVAGLGRRAGLAGPVERPGARNEVCNCAHAEGE